VTNLFTFPSLLTMAHGLLLAGGAMATLILALYALRSSAAPEGSPVRLASARSFARLTMASAVLLWLTVLGGTYLVFPLYRAAPPEGVTVLADYPRAFLMADESRRWLHAFGMEIKEHMPWIAAMLATAVAFIARRYERTLLADRSLRRMSGWLLTASFALVAFAGLLGVFVNKVAPLD
jgi:hypothetical protein